MTTKVVNLRTAKFDVYIGRPGRGRSGEFGNPYRAGQTCRRCGQFHATAGDTLRCFEDYFLDRMLKDRSFREKVYELRGKTLGCFCKPQPCHGDIIAKYLDALPTSAPPEPEQPSSGQRAVELRPANYNELSAREQREIDKALGILDWDGS